MPGVPFSFQPLTEARCWKLAAQCLLRVVLVAAAVKAFAAEPERPASIWKAGVARVNITPKQLMWMSGYGARDHEAEGKLHDLWAKALVIEDPQGQRLALITLDLVGIDRDFSNSVCSALREKHGLERKQIALACSHTHTGPVLGETLGAMFFLNPDQQQRILDYTADTRESIVAAVDQAVKNLAPARIAWGNGKATFAVNRRTNAEVEVPRLRTEGLLKGPVDHDVPVLSIRAPEGKLRAVVFGYACHATVLSFYQWTGDYPGFAQIELEKDHPDATALFFAGCAADQNPLPRRTVELGEKYGRQLANAVNDVLDNTMQQVSGSLSTSYKEVALPLDKLPTREELAKDAESTNKYVAQRGKRLLAQVDGGKELAATYPYPIQLWRLGPDLQWVTLGGEVVVDYSLRLKQELGRDRTWVAGYTNDVMAYIPSLRVLKEGGYEGGGAMVYYGLPASWGPEVENVLVGGVKELVAEK